MAFGIFPLRESTVADSKEGPLASLNSPAILAGEQWNPAGVLLATSSPVYGWGDSGLGGGGA